MTIEVTEEDIEGAQRNSTDNPVTRALGRLTGTEWHVELGNIAFETEAPRRMAMLDGNAFKHLNAFQYSGVMFPFEFHTTLVPLRSVGAPSGRR